MKMTKLRFAILVLIGVAVAYWLIGDVAAVGLMAFLGIGSVDKKKDISDRYRSKAAAHEQAAGADKQYTNEYREKAEKVQKEIEAEAAEDEADDTTPINKVVDNAKQDWS